MKKLVILSISVICLTAITKGANASATCSTPGSTWGYCEASGNGYEAEGYFKSTSATLYMAFDYWLDNPVSYGERVSAYVSWPTTNPNGISSFNLGLYYDQDLVLYPRHFEYEDAFSGQGDVIMYVEIVGYMYNSHYMKVEVWW